MRLKSQKKIKEIVVSTNDTNTKKFLKVLEQKFLF